MSPESQQPNSENTNAEIAFVQQALAAADRSERFSRIIVGVLGILAVVSFIWMHLHMFPLETLGGLLHSLLRVDLFFLVVIFALTMYIRHAINENTRIILRALATTSPLPTPPIRASRSGSVTPLPARRTASNRFESTTYSARPAGDAVARQPAGACSGWPTARRCWFTR